MKTREKIRGRLFWQIEENLCYQMKDSLRQQVAARLGNVLCWEHHWASWTAVKVS